MTLDLTKYPEGLVAAFLIGAALLIAIFTYFRCRTPRTPWGPRQITWKELTRKTDWKRGKRHERPWDL